MNNRTCKKRLMNNQGFTLAEMLLTVLILSIITVAVTSGALAARNVYQKVRQKAEAQSLMATVVSAMSADLSTAYAIEQDQSSAWTFISGNRGYRMKYNNSAAEHEIQVVSVQSHTEGEGKTTVPLVTRQTQTLGLYAEIQTPGVEWDSHKQYFTVNLAVKNSADGSNVEEQRINIRPLAIDWE